MIKKFQLILITSKMFITFIIFHSWLNQVMILRHNFFFCINEIKNKWGIFYHHFGLWVLYINSRISFFFFFCKIFFNNFVMIKNFYNNFFFIFKKYFLVYIFNLVFYTNISIINNPIFFFLFLWLYKNYWRIIRKNK